MAKDQHQGVKDEPARALVALNGVEAVLECEYPASMQWFDYSGEVGGAEEDRTPDLRIANATLSQLSYGFLVYMPLRQQETTLLILSHDFSYIPPFER